jgi:hypothetical protein
MEEGYDMWDLTWPSIVDLCVEVPGIGFDETESNKENIELIDVHLGNRVSGPWDGNEH